MKDVDLFGLAAEFETHADLVRAAETAYAHGYRKMDGFAPFPIEGLAQALGKRGAWLPLLVLLGGIVGAMGGYYMQWHANLIDYPINTGGRPLHSWPAFIPITFELSVLGGGLAAFFGAMFFSGLPRFYHPMFHLPQFERSSQDRFFLCIETQDELFDPAGTRAFLESLEPLHIREVPR
jgi:Protein of unknown function (DUF3341)